MHVDANIFEKYWLEVRTLQTTRGCPMDCSFCSITVFSGRLFRMRTVDDVVSALAAVRNAISSSWTTIWWLLAQSTSALFRSCSMRW